MTDYIKNLLCYKPVDQLDESERVAVLEEMSLETYDQLYRMRMVLRHMDSSTGPPAAIRERILNKGRMDGYFRRPVAGWWQRPVAIWQLAAAVLLAICATAGLVRWFQKPLCEKIAVDKWIVQRDTFTRVDTVWLTRWVFRARKGQKLPVLADTLPDTALPQASALPAGTSIGDMPALMEFLGGVQK
jgi:hypothetical protein